MSDETPGDPPSALSRLFFPEQGYLRLTPLLIQDVDRVVYGLLFENRGQTLCHDIVVEVEISGGLEPSSVQILLPRDIERGGRHTLEVPFFITEYGEVEAEAVVSWIASGEEFERKLSSIMLETEFPGPRWQNNKR